MILTPIAAEQAAPLLALAVMGKASVGAGVGVQDVMRGAALYGVVGCAGVEMAVALRRVDSAEGATCWITAAGARGHESYIDKLLPQVEKIAQEMGCNQVGLVTARGGVRRKMKSSGYSEKAVVMRKALYGR